MPYIHPIKSRNALYTTLGNVSFEDSDDLPENKSTSGNLSSLKISTASPTDATLNRSVWLRSIFYQTHKAFVHKEEDRATGTEMGLTGTGLEPTSVKYTTVEQLPEVIAINNNFTLPIVAGDEAVSANFPFLQVTPDTTDRKNKKYDVNLTDQAVKFILARTQPAAPSSSLPLLYCHASNVDNLGVNIGDGSVNNPYGTLSALMTRLDDNPTYVNYTIILLGGTFTTSQNIYRACSFYGFPGVIINYTGNAYLLSQFTDVAGSTVEDPNANRRYNGIFYFTGDITVNLINVTSAGGFSNLGFFNAIVGGDNTIGNSTIGKNWEFDFSTLNIPATSTYPTVADPVTTYLFPIIRIYGWGSIYKFKVKTIDQRANYVSIFETKLSNVTTSPAFTEQENAGGNLSLYFNNITLTNNSQLLVTGAGLNDYFGRTILVEGDNISLGSTGGSTTSVNNSLINTKLFIGKFNRSRSGNFFFNLNAFNISTGYSLTANIDLFTKRGTDYGSSFDIKYIFTNTLFKYNKSGSSGWVNNNVRLCFQSTESVSRAVTLFKNCLRPGYMTGEVVTFDGVFTTRDETASSERGRTLSGKSLDYGLPDTIVDTVGGGIAPGGGGAIPEVTKTTISGFIGKIETISSLWITTINI